MKIKGAIFDLDGTVLDSMYVWRVAGYNYLLSKGKSPDKELYMTLKPLSLLQSIAYFRKNYGITDDDEKALADILAIVEDEYTQKVGLKSGVAAFLRQLHESGVKMCIATASDRDMVRRALMRNGIYQYFENILTCTEVGHGKDEPDIYLAALELLGTPKDETWVFEDAAHAAGTAKNAGFHVCAVYDSCETEQEKLKKLADVFFETLEKAGDFFA